MFAVRAGLVGLIVASASPVRAAPPLVDVGKLDLHGVKLAMSGPEAEARLQGAPDLPSFKVGRVPCADGRPVCYGDMTGTGQGVAVKVSFREDLPAHPGRSVVTAVEARYGPAGAGPDTGRFVQDLLDRYGKPDAGGPRSPVLWWGVAGPEAEVPGAGKPGPRHPYIMSDSGQRLVRLADPLAPEKSAEGYRRWQAGRPLPATPAP